ncbi:MAG TPA: methyltransferase domain-containing protein [Chitinophagaceae bacterium]|nr:methyltransferase domain-containing protein [Chitinophagaceae bacterium]
MTMVKGRYKNDWADQMKEIFKSVLKSSGLYHPLQSLYRRSINTAVKLYYRTSYRSLRGKGFTCNFCGHQYERFVPEYPNKNAAPVLAQANVIAGYGKNVYCPHCMSKNRERLLRAVFESDLPVKGKRILQFSPEKHLFRYLSAHASVTTADLLPGFYKGIDKNVQQADATQLLQADNSFDVIVANHILEHIPNDTQAMQEMYRVLKPGGFAVLQVPFSETLHQTIEDPGIHDPVLQERRFGQHDHVRIYALNDYIARLQSAGFTVRLLTAAYLQQYATYAIQENECVIAGYKA